MTTLPSGLPVVVERASPAPLAVQISAQLQAAVTGGVLRAGDRLPSSRDLAVTLGVSRTVVTNAYARLFAEGWLEGRHGSGTYVADVAPASAAQRSRADPDEVAADATLSADARDWAAEPPRGRPADRPAARGSPGRTGSSPPPGGAPGGRRARSLPSRWPDPYGLPELRAEIAAYLRRSRGLAVRPEQVLVTQGRVERAGAAARRAAGAGRQGGHRGTRLPHRRARCCTGPGRRSCPCRVDAHGLGPRGAARRPAGCSTRRPPTSTRSAAACR